MTKDSKPQISIHRLQPDRTAPFQPLWAAASHAGLLRIGFGFSREAFITQIARKHPRAEIHFSQTDHSALTQLGEYLDGQIFTFTIPLDIRNATPFQQAVWQAVRKIPYGETRTYGQIAGQIGRPNAARAVGAANAANPIPIIIPCHRLVGADGTLRGYGGHGGLKTKQFLLNLERNNLPKNPA